MEEEESSEQLPNNKKQLGKSSIKRIIPNTPSKDQAYKEVRVNIMNFLETFEIEKTLFYPHLYSTMEEMVRELVKQ